MPEGDKGGGGGEAKYSFAGPKFHTKNSTNEWAKLSSLLWQALKSRKSGNSDKSCGPAIF